jgi:hypothetical protein
MTPKFAVRFALVTVVLAAFAVTSSAQEVEIYPNAGGFWPTKTDFGKLKADGIYGFKAGMFLDQNIQLEGSMGYINHFEMGNLPNPLNPEFGITQPSVYSILYDVNGAWNFGDRNFWGHRISPYVSVGVGGLTAYVKHAPSVDITGGGFVGINPFSFEPIPNTAQRITLEDSDTFFTFNYGGGVKAMRLWGPMGVRADIRGRTMPNFFGDDVHWPELTAGVTFTWGER